MAFRYDEDEQQGDRRNREGIKRHQLAEAVVKKVFND
jgi:hypothetical protein